MENLEVYLPSFFEEIYKLGKEKKIYGDIIKNHYLLGRPLKSIGDDMGISLIKMEQLHTRIIKMFRTPSRCVRYEAIPVSTLDKQKELRKELIKGV